MTIHAVKLERTKLKNNHVLLPYFVCAAKERIADIATDIESECGAILDRAELAANIAKSFISQIETAGTPEVAARYKQNSFIIGKKIKVIGKQESYPATAVDIDDRCALIVRKDSDGEIITLKSGEVSILPANH